MSHQLYVRSKRQARLHTPIVGALRLPFRYGIALLVTKLRGFEGVLSKRRDTPHRLGECRDWRKGKTVGRANRERWRLFEGN